MNSNLNHSGLDTLMKKRTYFVWEISYSCVTFESVTNNEKKMYLSKQKNKQNKVFGPVAERCSPIQCEKLFE